MKFKMSNQSYLICMGLLLCEARLLAKILARVGDPVNVDEAAIECVASTVQVLAPSPMAGKVCGKNTQKRLRTE
ncbi:MAG: hypothetical protein ACREX1_09260, partial [Advenella sp.]